MRFLIPLLVTGAGGLTVFGLMRRHGWSNRSSAAWALAAGPGVGFGLLGVVFFFWVFAGWPPPGRWALAGITMILALALALPVYTRRGDSARPLESGFFNRQALWPGSARARAALLAVLAIGGVAFGLLLWTFPKIVETQPYGGWDAKAIWNVRALFLYRASGDLAEIYSALEHGHPDYPLLLPASVAGQYSLLGGESLAIPAMTSLLFTLAAGVALFLAVARLSSPTIACAAVAVYYTTPAVWRWAATQYADIPLSYFLLMAVLTLSSQLDAERARRLPPVLAGLFLGLLAWTKNEGMVQAGLLAGAFALLFLGIGRSGGFSLTPIRDRWRRLLGITAGALPAAAALVLFKLHWSPVNETGRFLGGGVEKILNGDRWLTVVAAYGQQLFPGSGAVTWGLLWPSVVLCAVFFHRRRAAAGPPAQLFGAALGLSLGLSFMAYILTPVAGVQWHLDTSLTRLLLQLTPLALAWAVAGVGRECSDASRARPAPDDVPAEGTPA